MKALLPLVFTLMISLLVTPLGATVYQGNPNNYTGYLNNLSAGDTLYLQSGNYNSGLNVHYLQGTAQAPIVISGPASGNAAVIRGRSCCNTVSIIQSAHIVIQQLTINGLNIPNIDAVKAEGSTGNWAHHITLEALHIINHGANQQTVGISTKCPAWDWTIRRCIIDGAGTGIYLGNSNGNEPFVNGVIEYNLIKNTIGYNMEIKHQNTGQRNVTGMTQNGKTVIRYNVFIKAQNASSGGNARPNLLVGNFPASGAGANDFYEIYGNFF